LPLSGGKALPPGFSRLKPHHNVFCQEGSDLLGLIDTTFSPTCNPK